MVWGKCFWIKGNLNEIDVNLFNFVLQGAVHRVHNVLRFWAENQCFPLFFLFKQEFVGDSEWIHMDIGEAGLIAQHNLVPYYRQGKMTGRPTRALIQFLYQLACPEQITDLREL